MIMITRSYSEEIVKSNNGSNFSWAATQEARNKLWQARHDMYYALLAQSPGKKVSFTNITLPISVRTSNLYTHS